MKKLLICALIYILAPVVYAEDGVIELWKCELNEGKTPADAKAANSKWLKFQNDANPGANIRSWVLTSVVGETGGFGYMDAFPSLDAWAKSRALSETPAGAAIDAELNAAADCSMNRLFQATEH